MFMEKKEKHGLQAETPIKLPKYTLQLEKSGVFWSILPDYVRAAESMKKISVDQPYQPSYFPNTLVITSSLYAFRYVKQK